MMTSKKLFAILQELSESAYSETVLLMWLSNCENSILTDVFLLSTEDCHEYTEVSDAPLLVPHPFDKLYLPYMQAQMHHAYGETDKYRNYMQLYNSYRDEYAVHVLSRMDPAYGEAVKKGYYLSAYGIAKAHGYQGTEEAWLKSLIGPAGPEGPRGAAGKSAYELACENGFEGSVQDWLQSLVELLGEHTLTRYAVALTGFCNGDMGGDLLGLPIYDPGRTGEFVPMSIRRGVGEADGEGVTVLSETAVGNAIAEAVKLGAVNVTAAYEAAMKAGTVKSAKEFLWTLPAGRYYLLDRKGNFNTRYHLHAMAGEFGDDEVVARLLYQVDDFCFFYFYCGNSAYNAVPDLKIEGDTGKVFIRGKEVGSGNGSDCDCLPEINVTNDETEAMPEDCTLRIVLGAAPPEGGGGNSAGGQLTEAQLQEIAQKAAELVDVPSDEKIQELIRTELGTVEAELEALL